MAKKDIDTSMKQSDAKGTEVKAAVKAEKKDTTNHNLESYRVLNKVLLTEKSYRLAQTGQYVFEVIGSANKLSVEKAINLMYGVQVEKVNMIKVKPSNTFIKGRRGKTKGYKKAMVILKKGQTINI